MNKKENSIDLIPIRYKKIQKIYTRANIYESEFKQYEL